MRLPIWDRPKGDDLFDDRGFWHIPEDFPGAEPLLEPKAIHLNEHNTGPSIKVTIAPEVTSF